MFSDYLKSLGAVPIPKEAFQEYLDAMKKEVIPAIVEYQKEQAEARRKLWFS